MKPKSSRTKSSADARWLRRLVRLPRQIWGILDPAGNLRDVFISKPKPDRICWSYVADLKEPRAYVELPTDFKAAKRRGYKIKRLRLAA